MAENSFYLHEDEWAMVNILPAENLSRTREIAAEAQTFGEEHFDGQFWTEMYVIPEETYPITIRQISLAKLQDMFTGYLTPATHFETGYSTHRETVSGGFALVGEPFGVLYGSSREGIITGLHAADLSVEDDVSAHEFIDRVVSLGKEYNLILADWWQHRVIDLRNGPEVLRYLLSESDEDGAGQ